MPARHNFAAFATIFLYLTALTGSCLALQSNFTSSMTPRTLRPDLPGLPQELVAGLEYEKTTWANGSVYDDGFYSWEDFSRHSSGAPAGHLYKSESADPRLYALPPATSLSRIIYQSKNLKGNYVPVSAYVLFPYSPRKNEDGSLQVVAWAHGTSGIFPEAGPSHMKNLWQHYLAPFPLALHGYVVVAPDYAGLGLPKDVYGNEITHEYLASPAGANDVLYALEAAREAFPEIGKRFVTVGHSQGGGVVWSFAERMAEFPIEGYLGGVAISPMTRTLAIPSENNPVYELVGMARLLSIKNRFPEFEPNSLLTPEGQQRFALCNATGGGAAVLMACLANAPALFVNGWSENEFVREYDDLTAVGGNPIKGPLLVIQGENDPIVRVEMTTAAIEKTVAANPSEAIAYMTLANVTHVPAMTASQAAWLDWIQARFDGESSNEGYYEERLSGHRPAESYSPELTWYVEFASALYHAPV